MLERLMRSAGVSPSIATEIYIPYMVLTLQTAPTNPYLASLQSSSDPFTSGSSTPVKVKNIPQPSIPHVPSTRSHQQQLSSVDEDVQMASATNRLAPAGLGVDPRMLKFNNGGGYGGYAAPPPPPMHQRSSAREVPRERVLQPWEREVLDRADVKRKATVAQIYFLDYYCELTPSLPPSPWLDQAMGNRSWLTV